MGYKDPDKRREFARKWNAARRDEWFANNGPCRRCWSTENLMLHDDSDDKAQHRVWTWKKERRDIELAKCVILCMDCRDKIIRYRYTSKRRHGTTLMYDKGFCRCSLCRRAHAIKKRMSRGSKMSMSSTIEELLFIKNGLYNEIDSYVNLIEKNRCKIADIETTIRVIESINEHKTKEAEPDSIEQDDPEEVVPGESKEVELIDVVEDPVSQEIVETPSKPINTRHPRKIGIHLRPKNDVKVEALAGAESVLGKDFYCERCRAKFMNQEALDKHNEERHSLDQIKNKCPVMGCKRNFETEIDLENHILHMHPKFAKEYGWA